MRATTKAFDVLVTVVLVASAIVGALFALVLYAMGLVLVSVMMGGCYA